MKQYVLRRLALAVPTLLLVSLIVFTIMRLMPGDVVIRMVEGHAYAPTIDALRASSAWIGRSTCSTSSGSAASCCAATSGNSYWTRQPISEEFIRRFPVTLELALLTILVSVVIGSLVGIVSAVRQDSVVRLHRADARHPGAVGPVLRSGRARRGPAVDLLQVDAGVDLRRRSPTDPLQNLKIMLVPALVFGVTRAGPIMRIMRSALLDVLRQDYIRTAWSKGLRERAIVLRHALKNAMIPVISLIGLQMPLYIGGSVIIESIFRLPGVGLFFFEALTRLDYPVVQSVNLIIAAMVVGLNLAIDLSYAFLDPRIRYR